jgi:hypothetical protein
MLLHFLGMVPSEWVAVLGHYIEASQPFTAKATEVGD